MLDGDQYREYLERNVRFAKERVERHARSLSRDLENLARRMSTDDPIVSELGEVQALGTILDTYCARYAEARQTLNDYVSFKRDGEIGH